MQQKQEVMTCLKQVMLEKRLHIRKDKELENEMNGEISELTDAGKTKFYHRSGTHDDRLWALALAVYGSRFETISYHPFATSGKICPSRVEILLKRRAMGLPIPWPPPRERVGY